MLDKTNGRPLHELTIAERMKQYRLRRKWTLKRMAAIVGLSTTGVWNIENGKTQPHELTIEKIRAALPVLFEEEPNQGAA